MLHFQYLLLLQETNPKRSVPPCPRYQNLKAPHPVTRATEDTPCRCTVCEIARLNRPPGARGFDSLPEPFKTLLFPDQPVGAAVANQKSVKLCTSCYSVMAKGKRHVCTKGVLRENLSELVRNRSRKSKGIVVSSGLSSIFEQEGETMRGGTVTVPTQGRPAQVTMGSLNDRKLTRKSPRWSHKDLKRLQTSMNLSDRGIL